APVGTRLAAVRAPARSRVRDLRERQVSRGHGLAADRAALHPERRLAPNLFRHRLVLSREHAAARALSAAAVSDHRAGAVRFARGVARGHAYARTFERRAANATDRRRSVLLRGDVDA